MATCVEATAGGRATLAPRRPPARPRDLIVALRPDLDPDDLVHPPLIRLVAAFLDQGVADWTMADRGRGLLESVADVMSRRGPTEPWAQGLRERFAGIACRCRASGSHDVASEVIAEELAALAVSGRDRAEVVRASLLALRGWAGMVWQLEQRPDLAPCVRVPARLAEFLAVRLVLDRAAAAWTAGRLVGAPSGPPDLAAVWTELRDRLPRRAGPGTVSRAFLLHQLSQLLGLSASDIRSLDDRELVTLEATIHAFDSFARRRLLHLAYERRLTTTVLDALAALPAPKAGGPSTEPRRLAQVVFCIDDRCESLRRHLEETDPGVETFGAAGFFAVPMNYRGIDDWHATPLCPIVVRPDHTVTEVPDSDALEQHRARQRARRLRGRLRERLLSRTRTLFIGGLLSSVGGAIAAVPLVSRVVFPRLTTLLTGRVDGWGRRRIRTRLELYRTSPTALADGTLAGFTTDEMAAIVRRLLEDIGLTGSFARLVAILGHGSTSLNNPHKSAYECGACGGGRGGPNARAFALMANDPAVRAKLAAGGLEIPSDTVFVGGLQDTCSNGIEWYDVDRLPASHQADFAAFRLACETARALDAKERCRRFDSVPPRIGPAEALRAVEARAGDLAQVRPEYGHATTAMCVVGRRR
ncbi:MAG: putative inorganic carbon transporter subunit DabA, partial [Planctomycetota bacterium]